MKLAGYGRVSTDEEKQLDSLAHQLQFFSEFAAAHGHQLYRLYADEGISGKQLKKRDQFLRMLEDAQLHLFDLVVVKDVSRFARNTVDLLTSIRKLKGLGIEVMFVNNNQKILGESEFIITLLGAMAQEESANLSKRVKFGKLATSKKGRVPPRIFGYDRIDNFTLGINEEEADTVRRIFSLYLDEGKGSRLIALALEGENRRTKCNGVWTAKGVRRVIENPIYCGKYYNHKYSVVDFLEGTVEKLPPESYFVHDRPAWAIVTEERFFEAQRVMTQRRVLYQNETAPVGGGYSGRHLFSTLIHCAHCGRSFGRKTVTYQNTYVYWRCTTNSQYTADRCQNNTIVDEEELKRQLKQQLESLLTDKESLVATLLTRDAQRQATRISGDSHPQALERKRMRLKKTREKYQELYANDLLSMEDLKVKLEKADRELLQVERDLADGRAAADTLVSTTATRADAYAQIEDFLSLETVNNADLRRIVSTITVNADGAVCIHFKAFSDRDGKNDSQYTQL